MTGAVFLAYASAHSGSDRLQKASQDDTSLLAEAEGEIDWEMIGPRPLPLPTPDEARAAHEETQPAPLAPAGDDAASPSAETHTEGSDAGSRPAV